MREVTKSLQLSLSVTIMPSRAEYLKAWLRGEMVRCYGTDTITVQNKMSAFRAQNFGFVRSFGGNGVLKLCISGYRVSVKYRVLRNTAKSRTVYVKRCIWTDTEFFPVCRTHHNKSKYSVFQENSEIGEIQSFSVSPKGPRVTRLN